MAEALAEPVSRLCIFCRCVEPTSQPCPSLRNHRVSSNNTALEPLNLIAQFSHKDAALLETLQRQPSSLCNRCFQYNIVDVFRTAEPLDGQTFVKLSNADYAQYRERISRCEIHLGILSSLHLTPSCQLCRMIYRILPHGSLHPSDKTLRIVPFRSYTRITGWEMLSSDTRSQCAIWLGIYVPDYLTPLGTSFSGDGQGVRLAENTSGAIALSSSQTFEGKRQMNARRVSGLVDFSMIKRALDICESTHGPGCSTKWPAKMTTTRMIDVIDRKVIDCPDRCEYVALSYVWGGVMPIDDALKARTLPRTIEDAITVTKALSRRYLWVDALCINQRSNLSPEEALAKQQQLNMMHLIYECASVTIVALAGDDSNCGLAGVSSAFPRNLQIQEAIDSLEFYTVPPQHFTEIASSVWESRAWTLQEAFFARRTLYLTANQAYYECGKFAIPESDDTETYSEAWKSFSHPQQLAGNSSIKGFGTLSGSQTSLPEPMRILGGFLGNYTIRRLTNEEDSINACLGILSAMGKQLFPLGFVWGLPLRSHPQSIAWMHDRRCTPKRRRAFPTWSWSGWEGEVLLPKMLLGETNERGIFNPRMDMTVHFITVIGSEITLEGWIVELEIRTDPFSEASKVGSDKVIGFVTERNFLHNNTLPSGTYSCLVIQRMIYKFAEDTPEKEQVLLLLLDWQGQIASRRTLATLTTVPGGELMQAEPRKGIVRLV